jgi:ribosome-binding protein aMBF1 (putative translation factor)
MKARVGRSLDEFMAEQMHDPAFRAAYLKTRVAVEIANAVTIGRARKHWTQAQLAREIATTESVISRIESGRQHVSSATLRKLANALGVTFTIGPDPDFPESV